MHYLNKTYRSVMLAGIFLLTSCSGWNSNDHQGQVVLSSVYQADYAIYGYHFESGSFTSFPSAGEPLPDIIINKITLPDGTIKPRFSSPSNDFGFALVGESGSLQEAYDFFEQYSEFDTTMNLIQETDTVKPYQVYVLKTSIENYAKLNVRDVQLVTGVSGEHLEVMLDYYYQDDGTAAFPD